MIQRSRTNRWSIFLIRWDTIIIHQWISVCHINLPIIHLFTYLHENLIGLNLPFPSARTFMENSNPYPHPHPHPHPHPNPRTHPNPIPTHKTNSACQQKYPDPYIQIYLNIDITPSTSPQPHPVHCNMKYSIPHWTKSSWINLNYTIYYFLSINPFKNLNI